MPSRVSMPEFWNNYQNMMQNTFSQMQQLFKDMGTQFPTYTQGANTLEGMQQSWYGAANPDIRVDNELVTITFKIGGVINKNNIQVFVEGNYVLVDGALQARVPLPVPVLKYGGRGRFRGETLEVVLKRDKFTSKQAIIIEEN